MSEEQQKVIENLKVALAVFGKQIRVIEKLEKERKEIEEGEENE